jgi:hypothetical protein
MSMTGYPHIHGSAEGSVESGGRLRFNVAAGAASGSLITVHSQFEADDLVVFAMQHPASGTIVDLTGNITAVQASGIVCNVSSAGDKVIVVWLDRQPTR